VQVLAYPTLSKKGAAWAGEIPHGNLSLSHPIFAYV
jgi:hypothetical protein